MKIFRDGKEYELTFSEMIQAHEEYELDCMVEDVKNVYEQGEYDVELSEDDISEVASFALHNLSKNDSYFEAYWMSVEYTLDNYIDNLPVDEEEEE
jgi:predicted SpoU family rRNA methylase